MLFGWQKCQKNMRGGRDGRGANLGCNEHGREAVAWEVGEGSLGWWKEVIMGPDLGRLTFQVYFCVD